MFGLKPFRPAMTIAGLWDGRLRGGSGLAYVAGGGIFAAQSPPGGPHEDSLIGQPLNAGLHLETNYGSASAHPEWG